MAATFSCSIGGSTIALTKRGPEASLRRRGIVAGYGTKLYTGSNCMHVKISSGRNAHFTRSLASSDNILGKSLTFRFSYQQRIVRTGACRCATYEDIEDAKQSVEGDAKKRMEKTLETLKSNFNAVRTGRASSALLDRIEVEYYGSPVNLKNLAQVSVPDGSSLLVQPYDKSSLKSIEKAIAKSNLGLTPSNDGNVIRLSIPQLTTERRKELLKVVGKLTEESRVAIRNIRRDAIKSYEKLEKEKKLSKDNVRDLSADMQKLTDEFIKKADSLYKEKEKDLMTV
uniref:Ribosome-recycling factor, chloroplastic n=1 Tax=Araucaria cunninghamii TaxID=56994 RepID=A0A0D6R5X0_ARACU